MLRLVTPAPERSLLSIEELRSAAGVTGSEDDVMLLALGRQVGAIIARACNVARAGPHDPTLRRELLVETFPAGTPAPLVLSRRFVEIIDVQLDGQTRPTDDFEVEFSTGIVTGGVRASGTLSLTYFAGFDAVPADLVYAAILAVREFHAAGQRDPLIRSEHVDGVGRTDFQLGGTGREEDYGLPPATVRLIRPYSSVPRV